MVLFCFCLLGTPAVNRRWWSLVRRTDTVRARRLAVTFGPQLIALITRSADPASYWSRRRGPAAGALVEHYVAPVAGSCCKRAVGVRQAVRLYEALAVRQHMAALVELQRCVLRGVGERIQRRSHGVLSREMLVLVDHALCWHEAGMGMGILVQTGGHHVASARLGRNWTFG